MAVRDLLFRARRGPLGIGFVGLREFSPRSSAFSASLRYLLLLSPNPAPSATNPPATPATPAPSTTVSSSSSSPLCSSSLASSFSPSAAPTHTNKLPFSRLSSRTQPRSLRMAVRDLLFPGGWPTELWVPHPFALSAKGCGCFRGQSLLLCHPLWRSRPSLRSFPQPFRPSPELSLAVSVLSC